MGGIGYRLVYMGQRIQGIFPLSSLLHAASPAIIASRAIQWFGPVPIHSLVLWNWSPFWPFFPNHTLLSFVFKVCGWGWEFWPRIMGSTEHSSNGDFRSHPFLLRSETSSFPIPPKHNLHPQYRVHVKVRGLWLKSIWGAQSTSPPAHLHWYPESINVSDIRH